jgi:hypothetical protein
MDKYLRLYFRGTVKISLEINDWMLKIMINQINNFKCP